MPSLAKLSADRIAELLQPYLAAGKPGPDELGFGLGESYQVIDNKLLSSLSDFLELLLRWNARTNLTAITAPEEIVRRHFGESLFAARHLAKRLAAKPEGPAMLLDFGSGAGFPGLPLQLALPGLQVTLAESQGKKAAFLRETVRTLGLATEVWAARVEAMPATRMFDAVALRAVDRMPAAVRLAAEHVAPGGTLAVLGGGGGAGSGAGEMDGLFDCLSGWAGEAFDLPESAMAKLYLYRRN